ncbi:MAG: HAD family phosphatase [Clostridia bacterium]|nr:HAD family phosphatase [Clostridia bacterium]
MDERLLNAKVIIFDIGNVLLSFDVEKVCRLLPEDIRSDVQHAMFHEKDGSCLWAQLDLGARPNEDIVRDIAEASGHPGCEKHIHSLLEDFPKTMEMLPLSHLIPELKKMGKRIFALTNYPEPSLTRTVERFPFFALMDGMVVSSREKTVKPEEKIYRLLMNRYDIRPEEALFIDDRPENIQAAEKLGITGWHYTG